MSISPSQRTRLGIFVIVGFILLGTFAAIPLGIRLQDKFKIYYAEFKGESLTGLEQGAAVKFSGVPIGKVEKISYNREDITKIIVRMRVQEDFPMKKDMYAQSGDIGVTGLKYIEILGGTNSAPPMKPGSTLSTKKSTFNSITGKAEAIAAKVEVLLNHLNEITDPDSLESIKRTMDNLASITDHSRVLFEEAGPTVRNMRDDVEGIIQKVDAIASNVQSLTSTLNGQLSEGRLNSTFEKIDSTAMSLKNLSDNLSLMIRQSKEDFTISMENLREATENANQLTKVLAENPSLLLKGEVQKERDLR